MVDDAKIKVTGAARPHQARARHDRPKMMDRYRRSRFSAHSPGGNGLLVHGSGQGMREKKRDLLLRGLVHKSKRVGVGVGRLGAECSAAAGGRASGCDLWYHRTGQD